MRLHDRWIGVSAVVLAAFSATAAIAAPRPWSDADPADAAGLESERRIVPDRARLVTYDAGALEAILAAAPSEDVAPGGLAGVELVVPKSGEGELVLRVVESSIMAPELAARYPEIRTYRVFDPSDRSIRGRVDWTPHGFHAMVRTPEGTLFVDPYRLGDNVLHQAYLRSDLRPGAGHAFRCDTHAPADLADAVPAAGAEVDFVAGAPGGSLLGAVDLRTYRTVVAATIVIPIGVLLGIPLPAGMRLLAARQPEIVPWGWGMNGACSVVGAAVAVFVAMNWGFSVTLSTAALAYAVAAASLSTN